MIKGNFGGALTGVTKAYTNKVLEGSKGTLYKAREGLNGFVISFDATPTYAIEGSFPKDQFPSYLECYLGALECREMSKAQESNKSKGRNVIVKGVPPALALVIGGIGAGFAIDKAYSDDCGRDLSVELFSKDGGEPDYYKECMLEDYRMLEDLRKGEQIIVDWNCYYDTAFFFKYIGSGGCSVERGCDSGLHFSRHYKFNEEGRYLDDKPNWPDVFTIDMYEASDGEHNLSFFNQGNTRTIGADMYVYKDVEDPIKGSVKTNQTEFTLWYIAGTNVEDSLVYVVTDGDGKPEEFMVLYNYSFNPSVAKNIYFTTFKRC